ncbi:chloride intracellular channel exl-1-like [Hetaerina americana]|uniref:chloride intracellular channel exl-1-like n=1 Tax=Hetaerina americana TaxID=62018 RepID=UPI003A7F5529
MADAGAVPGLTTNVALKEKPRVTVFVRSSKGGSLAASPMAHQILMVIGIKVDCGVIPESKLTITHVDDSRPMPSSLRSHGISRVPAVVIGDTGEDDPETIISLLDRHYPGGLDFPLQEEKNISDDNDSPPSCEKNEDTPEMASRDFFSRFSFCVRGITDSSEHLDVALHRLNSFLLKKQSQSYHDDQPSPWICGSKLPSLLDCEVLPKLHHVRVAGAAGLAGQWMVAEWSIPGAWPGIWCYLHSAYSMPAFIRSCPSDKEIILHWADRAGANNLPAGVKDKIAKLESDDIPKISWFVPARADMVFLD